MLKEIEVYSHGTVHCFRHDMKHKSCLYLILSLSCFFFFCDYVRAIGIVIFLDLILYLLI
jgi:hypothetical protein